jgi:hypothetical protein
MTTAMERVWARMKTTANQFAKRDTFISASEAQRAILTMCHRENTASPPPDALEYLTSEMIRMSQPASPNDGTNVNQRTNR